MTSSIRSIANALEGGMDTATYLPLRRVRVPPLVVGTGNPRETGSVLTVWAWKS